MPTENELIEKLAEAELDLDNARRELKSIKEQFVIAETKLIGCKLAKERLEQQLLFIRRCNGSHIE